MVSHRSSASLPEFSSCSQPSSQSLHCPRTVFSEPLLTLLSTLNLSWLQTRQVHLLKCLRLNEHKHEVLPSFPSSFHFVSVCVLLIFFLCFNWRFLTQVYSITVRSCKAGHRTQGLMCGKEALHQPRHTPLPHYIILPKTVHTLPDHKILCIIHCV